ncbi:hypothetical protein DTW90_17125 [Neorhizobium sp. P12A]|uniref:hypothetical protein n=1 Tax=Rhizobium/Agrobacterium group TaxID=227290 RepID=UPI00104AFE7C|nr:MULTISPECIES: hypothetical protein [Rhizobium/Agrobacterium group]KAA0697868.1 hypothetical protein DTW90_17125 [Neorhizobium sp. P12A]TCR87926.1 hypothetical protein EV561_105273 [Rhizobium sp. BK376]
MKPFAALFVVTTLLTACAQASGGISLEPIPGSITYGGQPTQKLTKSPIGSQVPHIFTDQWGERVRETYIIQPDRTLRLVSRVYIESPFD